MEERMAPPKKKLSLPAALLKELDIQPSAHSGQGKGRSPQLSRKDQRKAQRVQKKQTQRVPRRIINAPHVQKKLQPNEQKSKLVPKPASRPRVEEEEEEEEEDFDMDENSDIDLDEEDMFDKVGGDTDDDDDDDDDGEFVDEAPQLSKSDRRKIDEEDAKIAALEKKLGLKKGKKPKSDDDDGLDDLLEGLDDLENEDEDEEQAPRSKRKAEANEWLAQKRRKANAAAAVAAAEREKDKYSSGDEEHDGLSELGNSELDGDSDVSDEDDSEENADDADAFEGFSEDEAAAPAAPRQRENPYVAPTTGVAKYVPPSLRKRAESSDQVDAQLRRRVQGLINRLTSENMIGILKDFSALYESFPRQNVTSTLADLVITLVCSPEKRPDGFFTMIAGFAAGAQKTLGLHVSADLIQRLVQDFRQYHDRASGDHSDAASKHLIALIAELYNMQVIGSNLIFDYVRLFLDELSELNTELLLRIIQTCGPSLRRDDPHVLKEIISQVKPADFKNVSVRTSFMIDEMKKLQSNKAKAAARNKDVAEQRTQIRKRIGTLSGAREIQPLRMSLDEIESADKNGKWWVVGASWSGHREKEMPSSVNVIDKEIDDVSDFADNDDLGIPDLWQLAKEQGFNTDIRQRIFVALQSATDYENAEFLVRKLRLSKQQRKEIAEVVVQTGEAQEEFNMYYWLVASRFCGDRELAFQFRRSLTTRFRKMGEDIDTGDDDYDAGETEDYGPRRVYNTAKLYGNLVANRSLGLDILKYRNLAALQEKTQGFVEVLLITVLQESSKEALKGIFGSLDKDLASGIQYFLQKYIRGTSLLAKAESKVVNKRCDAANAILEASLVATTEET